MGKLYLSIANMRVLIVEDQPLIAQRIKRFVEHILANKIEQLTLIDNVDDAQDWLFSSDIDLLLLDLDLHGQSGFELLKSSVSGAFHTIIISAHTQQAFQAFEYGVLDFVGKPFDLTRLEQAFSKLTLQNQQGGTRYLTIRKTGELEIVPLEKVVYIQGCGGYSELHLEDGSIKLHDKNLDKLLTILPQQFSRIHKSYLVDLHRVVKVVRAKGSYYQMQLSNAMQLPIGRTRYQAVKTQLDAMTGS